MKRRAVHPGSQPHVACLQHRWQPGLDKTVSSVRRALLYRLWKCIAKRIADADTDAEGVGSGL